MPEVILKVIKPKYDKIQTNQLDYVFEQAEFDYLNLARSIKKILD
jgi:hypothetical protein